MKSILTAVLLMLCFTSASVAQVAAPGGTKEVRKYAKSFKGQDLSGKKFPKENLDNCDFEDANLTSVDFSGSSLRNCNFRGATLNSAVLSYADLTGSDFRESEFKQVSLYKATANQVNFEGLDLSSSQLNGLKLRGAILRNVKDLYSIYEADFYDADLRGANFSNAYELPPAIFRKAKYDQFTRWHKNFDPKERGLVFEESKPEAGTSSENAKDDFKRLDTNEDGVLSGKEATAHLSKDSNGDGEITREEFTAGKR